jgi:hypothetical protein
MWGSQAHRDDWLNAIMPYLKKAQMVAPNRLAAHLHLLKIAHWPSARPCVQHHGVSGHSTTEDPRDSVSDPAPRPVQTRSTHTLPTLRGIRAVSHPCGVSLLVCNFAAADQLYENMRSVPGSLASSVASPSTFERKVRFVVVCLVPSLRDG